MENETRFPDVGLKFNAQKVGPINFIELRNADYGKESRMPTMPELIPLVCASLENRKYDVREILKRRWLIGNTAVHYFPVGIFVEDNPSIKNRKIVTPTKKELENRLGSHKEKGVVFSDDRSIRFAPHNFKRGSQTSFELPTNTGIIAFVGGEKNAKRLAKASKYLEKGSYFYTLTDFDLPQTRVAGLYLIDSGEILVISAVGPEDSKKGGYTFGLLR